MTFIGHSSFLLQMGGRKVLVDPVFATRLVVLRRQRAAGAGGAGDAGDRRGADYTCAYGSFEPAVAAAGGAGGETEGWGCSGGGGAAGGGGPGHGAGLCGGTRVGVVGGTDGGGAAGDDDSVQALGGRGCSAIRIGGMADIA